MCSVFFVNVSDPFTTMPPPPPPLPPPPPPPPPAPAAAPAPVGHAAGRSTRGPPARSPRSGGHAAGAGVLHAGHARVLPARRIHLRARSPGTAGHGEQRRERNREGYASHRIPPSS